jgi:hypothetical protein
MVKEWFVKIGGEIRGPLTAAQVRALATQGLLTPGDGLSSSPHGPWKRAGEVPGLFPSATSKTGNALAPVDQIPSSEDTPSAGGIVPSFSPPGTSAVSDTPSGAGISQQKTAKPPDQGTIHRPPPTSATFQKTSEYRGPKPAELQLKKRKERLRIVIRLAGAFCGVVVFGTALVVGVSHLRESLAARKREEGRRVSARPVATTPEIRVPSDLDSVIAEVGSALAGSAGGNLNRTQANIVTIADRWFHAATETAPIGGASIRIAKVEMGWPRLLTPAGRAARPRDPCLLIYVEISVGEGSREVEFPGWTQLDQPGSGPQLRDANNRWLAMKKFPGFEIEGTLPPTVIRPGQSVTDVLVFSRPEQISGFYELTLPAPAVGGHGVVRFRIPSTMIQETSGPPTLAGRVEKEKELEAAPAGESRAEVPADRGVRPGEGSPSKEPVLEEDSDRLPIPGVHE